MAPGPPPDNPTEETAKELLEVGRDLARLDKRRTELILQALAEGGSTRRVAFLAGLNQGVVLRIVEQNATPALRKKISDRRSALRERNDYWPFATKAEYDAFMRRPRSKR